MLSVKKATSNFKELEFLKFELLFIELYNLSKIECFNFLEKLEAH